MKIQALFMLLLLTFTAAAQNTEVKLRDLAVPASPAFILVDAAASMVQSPNTPKAFVLGVTQSFAQSGGFPQQYSAEFAPYWWLNPSNRNIYNLMGLAVPSKDTALKIPGKGNPFSGLKFTSVSIGFLNKDMIPDTSSASQMIVSAGVHTTVLKIYQKGYAQKMAEKIKDWHDEAQQEMTENIQLLSELSRHPERSGEIISKFKPLNTADIVKEINELVNQKPLLSWDISAAYATYGINNLNWKTGRVAFWTGISSYLPFYLKHNKQQINYINLDLSFRYLADNYQKNTEGAVVKANCVDIGGKIALELEPVSIGIESVYRFGAASGNTENRTLGVFNYKIAGNMFVVGSFGKNFSAPNKLIALFGINWGFGNESVKLP